MLSEQDRATVTHVVAAAKASSPEAVASAVRIHKAELGRLHGELHALRVARDRVERSIEMRDLALRLLAEP